MVTVRRSERQLTDRPVGDVSTRVSVTPQSLGSGIGQGIASLGSDLAKIAAEERREQENAALNKADTSLKNMRLFLANGDPEQGVTGYKDRKLSEAGEYQKDNIDLWDQTTNELIASVPAALQERVREMRDKHRVSFLSEIQGHTRSEMEKAKRVEEVNTIEASRKLAQANYADKDAVLLGIQDVADTLMNNAGDSDEARENARLRAENEASKTLTATVGLAIQEDRLEVASKYLDDENVQGLMRPETYSKLKQNLDDRIFLRDARKDVEGILQKQSITEDFSQAAFDEYRSQIDDEFDEGDPRKDTKISLLEAGWNDARAAVNRRDSEALEQYSNNIQRMSRSEALTEAYKLEKPELIAKAKRFMERARFPGDSDTGQEEDKNLVTAEQHRLKTEIRRAIRADFIKNVSDLNAKFGDQLTNQSFKELSKMFGVEAEQSYERDLTKAVEGAILELYPDKTETSRDELSGQMVGAVRDILGGTEIKPDRVKNIISLYKMKQEGTAGFANIVDVGGRRLLVGINDSTNFPGLISLPDASTPSLFAQEFSHIRVTELTDEQRTEAEQAMIADGLDPSNSDPVAYYNREVLGLPAIGQRSYMVAQRVRAQRFLSDESRMRQMRRREKEATGELLNDMGEFQWIAQDNRTYETGSDGMFKDLEESAAAQRTPNWMVKYFDNVGLVPNQNPATGQPFIKDKGPMVPVLDVYYKGLSQARDKTAFITSQGSKILNGALDRGQR